MILYGSIKLINSSAAPVVPLLHIFNLGWIYITHFLVQTQNRSLSELFLIVEHVKKMRIGANKYGNMVQ